MKKQIISMVEGFSLIELLAVISIIALISIAVLPNWTASSVSLEYQARGVVSDIRYAQGLSITTGQRYRFVVTSATSYQVVDEAGAAILLPSGSTSAVFANGITFGSLSNLPNDLVAFDSLGSPYITAAIPGTALAAAASITLLAGSDSRTISISPATGYVNL